MSETHEVEPGKSFALAMIHAGIVGYVAYVNPRPAGPEMTTDFEQVLAGASMGAARRRDLAKVALGYLGFGEPGVVPPDWVAGERTPLAKVDAVRNLMLDGATGGILYGDPAYAPFPSHPEDLPLQTTVAPKGDELEITLEMAARSVYLWCADPFRRAGDRDMAMKLYDRVELPAGLKTVRSVRVVEATWGGKPIETLDPVWALEQDQGHRYLHVKPGFARGGEGRLRIVLVASAREVAAVRASPPHPVPAAKPVDLADPAECRRLAMEVGDEVIRRRGDSRTRGSTTGARAPRSSCSTCSARRGRSATRSRPTTSSARRSRPTGTRASTPGSPASARCCSRPRA